MRFDLDCETSAGFARENITESASMDGNATYLWELLWAESNAELLLEYTPGIKATQKNGELVVVKGPFNGHGVVGLQHFSATDNREL